MNNGKLNYKICNFKTCFKCLKIKISWVNSRFQILCCILDTRILVLDTRFTDITHARLDSMLDLAGKCVLDA